MYYLNVTNLVSNVQSIVVRGQSNVSFLGTVWTNQSVNGLSFDFVQVLDGFLDLVLVRFNVDLENQSVVIFNFLQSGFRSNWSNNNFVRVQSVVMWNRLGSVFWRSRQFQGLWQSEAWAASDLQDFLGVTALDDGFLSAFSFRDSYNIFVSKSVVVCDIFVR